MWYFIGGLVWTIAVFVAGFFVGKKNGAKVTSLAQSVGDAVKKG